MEVHRTLHLSINKLPKIAVAIRHTKRQINEVAPVKEEELGCGAPGICMQIVRVGRWMDGELVLRRKLVAWASVVAARSGSPCFHTAWNTLVHDQGHPTMFSSRG